MNAFYRIFLAATLLLGLAPGAAFSIDFVSRAEYEAEKNDYKDLPLKILFKKLSESGGAEKDAIRNAIILKQTFDRRFQEKRRQGEIRYEKSFGVIQAIDDQTLRIWVPETDRTHDLYVGISRIPVVNPHRYAIDAAGIDRFAAIVYSLDKRIYKVEISFLPERPDGLSVKREGNENLVEWKPPASVQPPASYRVYVNEKEYATVKTPMVRIPRKAGRADTYTVKAVYAHGKGLVASSAAPAARDEITLAEIAQKEKAAGIYALVVAALNSKEWEKAKTLLSENRATFSEGLTAEQKLTVDSLSAFFQDIDTGSNISGRSPMTLENLDKATAVFEQAAQKARVMPEGIDVMVLARAKLDETAARRAALVEHQQQDLAGERFAAVLLALKPDSWESARKLLYDNRTLFAEFLPGPKKQDAGRLTAFFKDIDEGIGHRSVDPPAADGLARAKAAFEQADRKAVAMVPQVDVRFLSRSMIDDVSARQAALQKQKRELMAKQRYALVLAALNPKEWEKARSLLYENQQLFGTSLDTDSRSGAQQLTGFFHDFDDGLQQDAVQPETADSLAGALAAYQKADQKAQALLPEIDVTFLSQKKIGEIHGRRTGLEKRTLALKAAETYALVLSALNPGEWEKAESLLYENQGLLSAGLDADRGAGAQLLTDFFRTIDEGDRLSAIQPETGENLTRALNAYQQADRKAQDLLPGIDVSFISQQKIDKNRFRKSDLDKRLLAEKAAGTFALVLAALNPNEWEQAKTLLSENRALFAANLLPAQKATADSLTAFFKDIDKGSEISARSPVTVEGLDEATAVFEQAEQKARAMPGDIDVVFLARAKIDETAGKRAALVHNIQQISASEQFAAVLLALKPDRWESARKLLYDNQTLFAEFLSDPKRKTAENLISFFKDIDEGVALVTGEPLTNEKLDGAKAVFEQAGRKASAMSPDVDVSFVAQMMTDDIKTKRAVLEKRNRQLLAAETYVQVLKALTPDAWPTAKSLLADNRELFETHLDAARKKGVEELNAFFKDIDNGQAIADRRPESIENLEQALSVFRQAEAKAQAMPSDRDVRFLAELKIDEIGSRRSMLVENQERERLAAEAAAAAALARKKAAAAEKAAPKISAADRRTLVAEANQNFDTGDYQTAYEHYRLVYSKQIEKLSRKGKKRISGLLSLPPKQRAQLVFLVELEKLKKKHNNNEALIRRDLEEMAAQIENREGVWVVIPESRRMKILDRIAEY